GSLPLSAGTLVPRAVDRVLNLHRELHVTVIDGTYDALMYQLRHADIDVIVGALRPPPLPADIAQDPLFEDTLCVVARHSHPIFRKKVNGLQDLVNESWIVP